MNYDKTIEFGKYEYDQIDPECIELCDALNSLPGIIVSQSLFGHDKRPFSIWFRVKEETDSGLFFLTRCIDGRYGGYPWKIELSVGDMQHDDGTLPIIYQLHSDIYRGKKALKAANRLVRNMKDHIMHENFIHNYSVDLDKFNIQTLNYS